MANLERIRGTVELIESWEKMPGYFTFNMDGWYERSGKDFCNTEVCFAGAAVVHAKVPIKPNADYPSVVNYVQPEDGPPKTIERWAQEYFGLTEDEADSIFYATHIVTAEELKERIELTLGEKVFESAEVTA